MPLRSTSPYNIPLRQPIKHPAELLETPSLAETQWYNPLALHGDAGLVGVVFDQPLLEVGVDVAVAGWEAGDEEDGGMGGGF